MKRLPRRDRRVLYAFTMGLARSEIDGLYPLDVALLSGYRTGSITHVLYRLEANGYLISGWEPIDHVAARRLPRRWYALTLAGHELADEIRRETRR